MSARTSPHTLLGELTALPRPPNCFQGGSFAAGGGRREWKGGREELWVGEEGREGKGGMGKGGERGEVGGIAPWLLGDRHPCLSNTTLGPQECPCQMASHSVHECAQV